jgi:hypothetical protein
MSPKRAYFILVSAMAFADLFRYFALAIDDNYKCSPDTWTYAFHMLGNAAFFGTVSLKGQLCVENHLPNAHVPSLTHSCMSFSGSYSVICHMWQNSVGANTTIFLFRRNWLVGLNVLFLILSIVGMGLCIASDNNYTFFHTDFYIAYSLTAALKNLMFFVVIAWSGSRIVRPIRLATRFVSLNVVN